MTEIFVVDYTIEVYAPALPRLLCEEPARFSRCAVSMPVVFIYFPSEKYVALHYLQMGRLQ